MEHGDTQTLRSHLKESATISIHTVIWLAKIMVPASALVLVLKLTGLLHTIATALQGAMRLIDLPGEAAIAVITGIAVNLYGVIAIIPSLSLTLRQATILAVFSLVAHSLVVEIAIARRIGTPVARMMIVRLGGAFVLSYLLTHILPRGGRWSELLFRTSHQTASGEAGEAEVALTISGSQPFSAGEDPSAAVGSALEPLADQLWEWCVQTVQIVGVVAILVTTLLFAIGVVWERRLELRNSP